MIKQWKNSKKNYIVRPFSSLLYRNDSRLIRWILLKSKLDQIRCFLLLKSFHFWHQSQGARRLPVLGMGVARRILQLCLGIRVSGIEVVPGIPQLRLGILGGSGHFSQPEKMSIFSSKKSPTKVNGPQRAKVKEKLKGTWYTISRNENFRWRHKNNISAHDILYHISIYSVLPWYYHLWGVIFCKSVSPHKCTKYLNYTLFFIRTTKIDLKLAVLKYSSIFSLKCS